MSSPGAGSITGAAMPRIEETPRPFAGVTKVPPARFQDTCRRRQSLTRWPARKPDAVPTPVPSNAVLSLRSSPSEHQGKPLPSATLPSASPSATSAVQFVRNDPKQREPATAEGYGQYLTREVSEDRTKTEQSAQSARSSKIPECYDTPTSLLPEWCDTPTSPVSTW